MVRRQTLQQHPEVAQALAALAGQISDREMQELNYAVDGQHRAVKEVVHDFLRRKRSGRLKAWLRLSAGSDQQRSLQGKYGIATDDHALTRRFTPEFTAAR